MSGTNQLATVLPLVAGSTDLGSATNKFAAVHATTVDVTTLTNSSKAIDCDTSRLTAVAAPIADTDATNRTYVQTYVNGLETLSSLTSVGTIGTGAWEGTPIADTYLATISAAGKVGLDALDIGGADATSGLTTSSLFVVDEDGNGENRRVTAANLLTFLNTNTSALTNPTITLGTSTDSFTFIRPAHTTSSAHSTNLYGSEGQSSGGVGGDVNIRGGNATGAFAGANVTISGGNEGAVGAGGQVRIGGGDTSVVSIGYPGTNSSLYVSCESPLTCEEHVTVTDATDATTSTDAASAVHIDGGVAVAKAVRANVISSDTSVTAAGTVTADAVVADGISGFSGPAADLGVGVAASVDNSVDTSRTFTFDKDDAFFNVNWVTAGDAINLDNDQNCAGFQFFDVDMSAATTYTVTLDVASFETRFVFLRCRMSTDSQTYTFYIQNSGTNLGTDGFSVTNDDSADATVSPFAKASATSNSWFMACIDRANADGSKLVKVQMGVGTPSEEIYDLFDGHYPMPTTVSGSAGSITVGRSTLTRLVGFPLAQNIVHTNVQYEIDNGAEDAAEAIDVVDGVSMVVVQVSKRACAVKLRPRMAYAEVNVCLDTVGSNASAVAAVFATASDGTTARNFLGVGTNELTESGEGDVRMVRLMYMPHRGRWAILADAVNALDSGAL